MSHKGLKISDHSMIPKQINVPSSIMVTLTSGVLFRQRPADKHKRDSANSEVMKIIYLVENLNMF